MKKIALIAIVVVMVAVGVFALVSCADENTLTVVTSADFAPFEYMEGGEFKGFDMDLIREIGKRMDKKVKITTMDFEGVIGAVSSGQSMVAIAALTINPERAEAVAFSDSYLESAYQVIIVKKDNTKFDGMNKEQIIAALQGTKINVAKGQVGQAFAQGSDAFGYSGIQNADVKIYENISLAGMAIKGDEVAFADNWAAAEFCDESKGEYKYINVELTKEHYGIAVAKDNETLKNQINEALAAIKADGTYDELLKKYEVENV